MCMLDEESRYVVTYILMCVYERPVLRENYSCSQYLILLHHLPVVFFRCNSLRVDY